MELNGEGVTPDQKYIINVIIRNSPRNYSLKDELKSNGYTRFMHFKKDIEYEGREAVDQLVVLMGKHEDLKNIQFHILPHVTHLGIFPLRSKIPFYD